MMTFFSRLTHKSGKSRSVLSAGLAFSMLLSSSPAAFAAHASDGRMDVCTMTNAVAGNEVRCFRHAPGGALVPAGTFATGGNGTGGGLGNQGGLVLNRNKTVMLVVNAGSNSLSAFRKHHGTWVLGSTVDTQGTTPVSVTIHGDLVYVLNAGGDGNIAGFHLDDGDAMLTFLPGSVRPLSGNGTAPAQIAFDPDGDVLLVTEKATQKISTYVVDEDGIANGPVVNNSLGQTPFGFAYDRRGHAIVSEAFGGTASALSSYMVASDGQLTVISGSVHAPGQQAACWVVLSKSGRIAYITNTATNTISSYRVQNDGSLALLQAVASTTSAGPIDMAVGHRYLYVLTAGGDAIEAYRADHNGDLDLAASVAVPDASSGLVSL